MSDNNRKVVIMFGPPGAGKGTQGNRLVQDFKLAHISTGDALREAVKKGSELGRQAKAFMDSGALVPDDLIIPIVEEKMRGILDMGYLFDGFPRTLNQAEMLDEMLRRNSLDIDRVIYLNASQDVILERLTGRRVCPNCGATYHVKNIPPKQAGICDKCGAKLVQRDDDTPETVLNRLDVYRRQTADILDFYRAKGLLTEIDGSLPIAETYPQIRAAVS